MTHVAAVAMEAVVKDYGGLRPLRLQQLVVMAGDRVALSGLDATAAEVLVNLINGAILPDEGEVRIFGQPTAAIANETEWFALLDRFGIVTPRAVFLEMSSVRQNLALPFTIDLDELNDEVTARTDRLAAEVDLPAEVLDAPAQSLSAASRMRIHLARALAPDPEVLLMEHPTAPIPREDVARFASLVKRVALARALTLVIITEDAQIADTVATAHYRVQGGTGALVRTRGWRRWLKG